MKQEDFSLALNALLPGCEPEAASRWAEFATECVDHEQFVYFIPTEYDTAVEKWLDAIFAGLYAVKQEHGSEIAAKAAGLCCQRCALYPGEMMAAAVVLKNGGDAEQISGMMASGDLDMSEPFFFDLPDGAALTCRGPEIGIEQSGVPCGLVQKRMEPGFLLADGTALLESERDDFGRYRGGAGMDGMYLQTGRLYAPVLDVEGQVRAFREVRPVTAQEREAAFLTSQEDAFAIYRMRATTPPEGYVPLVRLQKFGESPLAGHYDLIHVVQLAPGTDPGRTLDACRQVHTLKPGDIAAFKQDGSVMCWYVDQLSYSKMHGLLGNHLETVKNDARKPSVMKSLRQYQRDTEKSQNGAAPPVSRRDPER